MYAHDAHTISEPDVLARWGYSEVINSHSENCYADVPNINEIRKKRESGMPCSALPQDERRCPENKGGFGRFAEWVDIPPLTDHPADARNVICRPLYEPPTDALAIGRHNANPVLVDGFHRAVALWRCAALGALLQAYVPV